MRILLISDWNPGRGGAEQYVGWLLGALRAAGHEVRLLTSNAGTAGDGRADYVAWGSRHPAAQAFLQIFNPFAYQTVDRAVREFQPDVAHVHLFQYHLSSAVLPALGRVPTVVTLHDYKQVCPLGTKQLPDGRECREPRGQVCRRGGCLGTLHALRDEVRYAWQDRWLAGVVGQWVHSRSLQAGLARLGVVTHWLPLPVQAPGEGQPRRPSPQPSFLYVGRLEREKGVMVLPTALRRVREAVPTARLVVVGEGSLRGALRAECERLGLGEAVEFAGWRTPLEVGRYLSTAWALVAPSWWAEPFGLVAPEAILSGVPVLASARGGLAESVEPGRTGLLFENGNWEELADRMRCIASGSAFPGHGCDGEAQAELRRRHDPATHVARAVEGYREVAAGRSLTDGPVNAVGAGSDPSSGER